MKDDTREMAEYIADTIFKCGDQAPAMDPSHRIQFMHKDTFGRECPGCGLARQPLANVIHGSMLRYLAEQRPPTPEAME